MDGRGANVVSSGLHLSTNYKNTSIISILIKCRKSKTAFLYFATLLGKLQRPGNCIPSPTKTDNRQCSIFSLWRKKVEKVFSSACRRKERVCCVWEFLFVCLFVGLFSFVLFSTKIKKYNQGNMAAFGYIEDSFKFLP